MKNLDRREFLERSTLAAASLAVLRGQTAQAAQAGMFISLPPWAVARNVPWPEQAKLAARVGYRGIDWAFGPARQAGVDATRALLAEIKIQPTIVNLPMMNTLNADEAAFKAQLPKLDEDAAFSQAIGCKNFQLVLPATTPNGQTKDERWKVVRDRLAAISEVLAKHDMRLGLEFLGPMVFRMPRAGGGRRGGAQAGPAAGAGAQPAPPATPAAPAAPPVAPVTFVYTLPETVKLSQESGPNIGATLDAWHWYHSGGTVAEILATDKSRIIHVHVSDAKQMPPEEVQDNMRWLPGEGIIDLVGFFQALKKIGYQGGVAPETIGPRIPDTMAPEESARLGLETTMAVMKKAGVL
ncbi:MAG: sugar phosphate isomerase/epimerase family protein [Vicinamibacterales bacterium]